MAKLIDKGSQNPRMQCSCCGKWKRLMSKGGVYLFDGACGYTGADHLAGDQKTVSVCTACCHTECKKIAARVCEAA